MAYQIFAYADRAMTRRLVGVCDQVGDSALAAYGVSSTDVLTATPMGTGCRPRYGYDGAWHDAPPPEYTARLERQEMAAASTAAVEDIRRARELLAGADDRGVVRAFRALFGRTPCESDNPKQDMSSLSQGEARTLLRILA
jgi:hypothetical protein